MNFWDVVQTTIEEIVWKFMVGGYLTTIWPHELAFSDVLQQRYQVQIDVLVYFFEAAGHQTPFFIFEVGLEAQLPFSEKFFFFKIFEEVDSQ